ncbi:ATP-binding protein [Sphaerisporangium aureirubrum]|uniref:ATP-binding protein n=1 Tax=Sphaerisporangium aureirubrum TaxID=1544736 RepID=A0ABW1NMU7_9ACTN
MMTSTAPRHREVRWELPADPGVSAKCRALVRETLTGWQMPGLVDDVVLVVSELLGNALIHGGPPILLTLRAARGVLSGAVTDRGPGWPRIREAGADREHGRGLRIVAALTDGWGVDPVPTGIGKTIWFTLAHRPAGEDQPSRPVRPVVDSLPFQ